ncbi:globin-like [Lingula anatina]|uniref:Nitrite reductase MB n=1 Tax=Lingula anatina TaxID=7574 RepID=A0A1S3HE56_LINAN|nr:globin [Lingula anatina]XP_013384413.1 globin-like [Lingula anatina]|eukprot:XP_013384357.1 globin [Lingula anatina]
MGAIWSMFFGYGGSDTVDEKTGLTEREKNILRYTWKGISTKPREYGPELFLQLFTKIPETKKYFRSLKDKSNEELRKSFVLRAHGATVVNSLTSVVESLDDADCLVSLLKKIGTNHQKIGIPVALFGPEFCELILSWLENSLGSSRFGPTERATWDKALSVIMSVIKSAYDEK